jgi:8-oxo-dGTP diphosphatase
MSKKTLKTGIGEFLKTAPNTYLPSISVNTVIFSFQGEKLRVLLINYSDMPFSYLPGGYVGKTEALDDAARRILAEHTGLTDVYIEQFYTFGGESHSQDYFVKQVLKELVDGLKPGHWFEQRFIQVCYYALLDERKVSLQTPPFVSEARWIEIEQLPKLLFDHKAIVEKALQRLQTDLDQKLVGLKIMNETFTMGELQKLYEAIYQKPFHRNNFQRKMLSMNLVERLEKKYTGKAHKSPYLYRFRRRKKK